MKDMKRNIRHLSKEQYRFLQKYLQLNAKDVKGENHYKGIVFSNYSQHPIRG